MPRDVTNLPLRRPLSFRDHLLVDSGGADLHAEQILLEEFNHASVMAYQATDERTNLLNLYLLLMGVVVTAASVSVGFAQTAKVIGPILAVIAGLAVSSVVSFGFFLRLLRLTGKYHEALLAMDEIKEFYIRELRTNMPHLGDAFHWRLEKMAGVGASSGTTLFIGSIIAVIGSFSLASACELVFYYTHDLDNVIPFTLTVAAVHLRGFFLDVPVFFLMLVLYLTVFGRARARRRKVEEIVAARERYANQHPDEPPAPTIHA